MSDDRMSHPDLLANAPPWMARLLERLDGLDVREQERAEMAHRGANKMASALTRAEANLELTKQEVRGARADFVRIEKLLAEMEVRLNQKIVEVELRLRKTAEDLEERIDRRITELSLRVDVVERSPR